MGLIELQPNGKCVTFPVQFPQRFLRHNRQGYLNYKIREEKEKNKKKKKKEEEEEEEEEEEKDSYSVVI
jgi:hypothetical protein